MKFYALVSLWAVSIAGQIVLTAVGRTVPVAVFAELHALDLACAAVVGVWILRAGPNGK